MNYLTTHAFKQAGLSGIKSGAELAMPSPLAPSLPIRCARAACPDSMTQDSAWPQTSVPQPFDFPLRKWMPQPMQKVLNFLPHRKTLPDDRDALHFPSTCPCVETQVHTPTNTSTSQLRGGLSGFENPGLGSVWAAWRKDTDSFFQ